ncbi:MAG: hypothetical protein MK213_09075, partial [Planctomycetes bacterium]|nr:hypothetical protein [Planctomycetota bacterium]
MLASTLCLGLLLQAQDAPVAPFQFSLPVEYGPFTRMRGAADEWESLRADREGRFAIAHLVLAERGATSERVAQDLRQRKWTPLMSQREHQMEPWQGTWAGGSASGTQLSFQINGMAKAIWERVFLHGDRLLVGSWEGPLSELEAATRALDSFRPPAEWRASPPVDVDPAKGAGPSAEVHPSIGHFDIHLLVPSGLTQPSVELSFTPEVPAQ